VTGRVGVNDNGNGTEAMAMGLWGNGEPGQWQRSIDRGGRGGRVWATFILAFIQKS
jgi:hypothetical protein